MNRVLNVFQKAYTGKNAMLMNTGTAGALGFIGDVVAQNLEQRKEECFKWDFKRSRNMGIVCLSCGPLMHYWYKFLDTKFKGKSSQIIAKKVALDVLSGPVWYTWYLGGISLLKIQSFNEFIQDFKDKLPIIICVDLALWPIFQTINFAFFPPHYRVLVLKSNELFLDVVYAHIVNNTYTLRGIYDKFLKK